MKRRNFQIAAGLVLAAALLTYPLYSRYFAFTVEQALGMFFGLGTSAFWYFDGLMNTVINRLRRAYAAVRPTARGADAIRAVRKMKKHCHKVRIIGHIDGPDTAAVRLIRLEAD